MKLSAVTIVYTSLDRAFNFGDVHIPVFKHMAAFLRKLPELMKDGVVEPLPIKM